METLLLSPDSSPSSVAGLVSDTRALPVPRRKPLKPASQKEIALLNFVDSRILTITRRFAKKCSSDKAEDEEARGYNSFDEVAEDVEQVLNAVWVSGTPTLQIPFLLTLAGIIAEYMSAFVFAEGATTRVTDKLDEAFAILLTQYKGTPSAVGGTKEPLVSITDRVRIRSVIETSRITAVEIAMKRDGPQGGMHDTYRGASDSEFGESMQSEVYEHKRDSVDMSISRIYERALTILGDSLG